MGAFYFKPNLIQAIVDGNKNQTRRVCKPNERLLKLQNRIGDVVPTVDMQLQNGNDRKKWAVGNDYAVSRMYEKGVWLHALTREWRFGKPEMADHSLFWEPLRIRLLSIRREPLQAITEADAVAEGVICRGCYGNGYYLTGGGDWTGPYESKCECDPVGDYRHLWESINGPGSWDANPNVWVLTFEVVKS